MTLVCGSDLSESSRNAVVVAAALARRTEQPLCLVHAVDVPAQMAVEPAQALQSWAETVLRVEAERLGREGVSVSTVVKPGHADRVLLDVATQNQAKWLVVAAAGKRGVIPGHLGSQADRVAQQSHIPVLVVRDAAPFQEWAEGKRPLKVVVGVDSSTASEHALHWLTGLCALGPCDVVVVHLYWPPEQFARLGLAGVRSYVDPDPEVTRALERELAPQFKGVPGIASLKFRLEPHLGRIADRLAHIAGEEHADLVVVGTHARSALMRAWEGSVSRGVLRETTMTVACIPGPAGVHAKAPARVRTVLVATDFSAVGDSAVPLGYSIVGDAGVVHLVHVVKGAVANPIEPRDIFDAKGVSPQLSAESKLQLLKLVPAGGVIQGTQTQAHILQSNDAASAIAQAAERLGAEVICLGTHGRSGLSKALLGSVAEALLHKTHRPVLLARAPTP